MGIAMNERELREQEVRDGQGSTSETEDSSNAQVIAQGDATQDEGARDYSADTEACRAVPAESVDSADRSWESLVSVGLVEAILFASPEPLALERIAHVAGGSEDEVAPILERIRARGDSEESGVELVQVAGKFQLRTKRCFAARLALLREEQPRRLSGAALETLAIVAYRQPIVRSDIEKIRGVDCTPTLKTLLDRGVIKIVGHQASVGQPALYGTTEEFLTLFGLNSLSELPTLRDLQEFDADPGETESNESPLPGGNSPEASASESSAPLS
jgi:segregation and condensation protein B